MNIADNLTNISGKFPNKTAVRFPVGNADGYKYEDLNFSDLESKINKYANGLKETGFKKGQKVLLFVRPSLEFHALVFAIFKISTLDHSASPSID